MKRITTLFLACTFAVGTVLAQEDVKTAYYPTAGDYAVGIEASPVLDFIGNMFNGTNNQASDSRWDKSDYTLHGRYFLTDNSALRLHLRFNPNKFKTIERNFVTDDAAKTLNPLTTDKVEDKKVTRKNDWRIAVGYQQFRGSSRFRGFYGGDLFYRYERTFNSYYYGNIMNEFNTAPTTTPAFSPAANRVLKSSTGGQHTVGAVGFTGVEFYYMKHACIGFEVGLVLQGTLATRGWELKERMVGSLHEQFEAETTPPEASFHIGTNFGKDDRMGGSTGKAGLAGTGYGNFYLMFHF